VDRDLAIRVAALYLPICTLALLWFWRRPSMRLRVGLLLGVAWNLATLPLLQWLAVRASWWQFQDTGMLFLGMPLELYLGWAVLWGALPQLAFARLHAAIVLGVMAIIDPLAMPELSPVLVLEPGWLIGEACGLLLCFLPAHYLAQWTAEDSHVRARVALQATTFVSILLLLIPGAILSATGDNWGGLFRWSPVVNGLFAQGLVLLGLPGWTAAIEFARHGGTPIPFDPPPRLVITGPYAYVASPMQCSAVLVLLAWGAWLGSWWVAATGAVAIAYGAGLANWSEGQDLAQRFGANWQLYRRQVRSWWPRWRPVARQPATLYIAGGCERCSQVRRWYESRGTVGLDIVDAELHPSRDLQRVTYVSGCIEDDGVAALARALGHIHLGWACAGWAMQLPVVAEFVQLLVDASGGEARLIRRQDGPPVCES
jgi:protein-S-isoprenylcysteine O-methyltransferase Ste14